MKCTRVFYFKSECLSINKENYFKIPSLLGFVIIVKAQKLIMEILSCLLISLFTEIKQTVGLDSLALSGGYKTGGKVTLIAIMNEMMAFRAEVHQTNQNVEDNMNKYSKWVVDRGKKIDGVTTR